MKPFTTTDNRAADIERTADEIRAQFLIAHAGEGASEFYQLLYRALLNQNLTDADKLIYALGLAERKNFFWSNERMAQLSGKSLRVVERCFRNLEREGCIESKHRRRNTAIRTFKPAPSIVRAASELLPMLSEANQAPPDLTVQDNQAPPKMTVQEFKDRQICRQGPPKMADYLSSLPQEEEEKRHTAREACDFSSLQAIVATALDLTNEALEPLRADADRWGRKCLVTHASTRFPWSASKESLRRLSQNRKAQPPRQSKWQSLKHIETCATRSTAAGHRLETGNQR